LPATEMAALSDGLPRPPDSSTEGEGLHDPPSTPAVEPSSKRLKPLLTISENSSEIFAIRWSPDGRFIASGTSDGSIMVFNAETGKLAFVLQQGNAAALPATALRFRPEHEGFRTKNVLVSTNAVGTVQHWHVTSSKCLHSFDEPENQIYAVDFSPDGRFFVTGGKDASLRLYDESRKELVATLRGGNAFGPTAAAGHSNRIFAARFHPGDPNLIVSGGWDNTIQIWDCRQERSIQSIYGPHICGDGLDVLCDSAGNTQILTASWRPENPLEIWDLRSSKRSVLIDWEQSLLGSQACLLYTAQFSKSKPNPYIAAGGSGANEAKVFEMANGRSPCLVGTVAGLDRGVFTVDWHPFASTVAIGSGDGTIRIMEVVDLDV